MKLSIIIPTYNEEKVIGECLKSLARQSYQDFEVIVVDDGSSDKTMEVLKGWRLGVGGLNTQHSTLNGLQLSVFEQDHKGAGAARNFGAKRAKGEILVFVDADMTFDQDFIRNLTLPIIKGVFKGTFSKDELVSNWEDIWSKCWNINENWEKGKRHPKNYPDHQPVFRAILKSEFDRVGGFTPGGYDDDWSLYKKLGYQATSNTQSFTPKAIFYHKNPSTLSEIFRHAQWVGKRRYKIGVLGYMVALIRSSLPVSLMVGLYKGFKNNDLRFMLFKIVYDFGVFVGVLKYIILRKGSK